MPDPAASNEYKPLFSDASGRCVVYADPPDFAGRSWPAKIHTRGDFRGMGELLAVISRLDNSKIKDFVLATGYRQYPEQAAALAAAGGFVNVTNFENRFAAIRNMRQK